MDEKTLETINALVGGLAHEIKTPLSTVSMNLQLIRESLQNAEGLTAREEGLLAKVRLLEKEVHRLGETLNEFLRFVRGKRIEKKPGSINLLVNEILDFVQPEAEAKSVTVHRHLDYRIPLFHFDFEQVRQAVLNVIKNGVEAVEPEGDLYVETAQHGVEIRISVTNTGSAIPSEDREKVFDLYYSTKPQGTGLGLSMTRRVLEAHGGSVEIDPEPSWGVRFVLRLPMDTKPPPGGGTEERGRWRRGS